MAEVPITKDFIVKDGYLSFILPFAYRKKQIRKAADALKDDGFHFFTLDDPGGRIDELYEGAIEISQEELDQYFLPYVEQKIFPPSVEDYGFHRFYKVVGEEFSLKADGETYPFRFMSLDVILGPFGIAFLTSRVRLQDKDLPLSSVLNFMQHFRATENKLKEEKGSVIFCDDGVEFSSIHEFLFGRLASAVKPFVIHDDRLTGYFGSLPYFEDERMFVTSFLFAESDTEISEEQLFRIGRVDGLSPERESFISASNMDYIRNYLDQYLHDRWAPDLYTIATDFAYSNVTTKNLEDMQRPLAHFMGTHYYNFMLHYFYRIMLLRVSFEYSRLKWDKDEEYLKRLIELITIFSSWYHFKLVSVRQEGRELGQLFRRAFSLDDLFEEVRTTLEELYRTQENSATNRMNLLLFFLTVFTVISGIYGMNLVIDDWKNDTSWKEISSYGVFGWIAFVTALLGIGMSIYLFFTYLGRIVWRKLRRKFDDMDF
ncbi:hypothetical protein SAMN04488127_0346 [Bhargavaea ginsengi]|uniref:Uncharacterized protein n=1 Tax=Bhargavaea ginsengi TaxID=426757 RepID=A0A1H6T5L1_9BACL|nr:hypothetical protein [Bhargavaea ginsengi]SEI74546.1 hypothetical protein SAMN04488127_0346 [Bhargavaea ginsengi]